MTNATFHLAPRVPPLECTSLSEVVPVVGAKLQFGRKAELDGPAMTNTEISTRAAEFVELRRAGMLRRRD